MQVCQHFDEIQATCNNLNIPIVRLFSIARHSKGLMDNVCGLAKCVLRRFVRIGSIISSASD